MLYCVRMGSGWWVSDMLNAPTLGPAALVAWIVIVIGSIVLHELAHGWAALWLGDSTPRDLGHMTWNPLVHMGGYSLIMFAVIGIAWGAMPVNPSRLRGRYGDAIVAVAGPAMNVLLALVSFVCLIFWIRLGGNVGDPLAGNLERFFYYGAMLNLVLAAFNLLPIYSPFIALDGGHIAADFSRRYRELAESENGRWIMLGGFLLMFWFAFDPVIYAIQNLVSAARDALV